MLTTTGNLNKQIVKLAWPVVLQNLGRSLAIAVLDSIWIGKLGPEYLAAITVGSFMSWGLFALSEMVPIGTNSLVSQSIGAKDNETAKYIGTLNLFNAIGLGIMISVVAYPLLPVLYHFTNIDTPKQILANQYLMPILLLLPAIILFETGNAIFRGNGNTQTPFLLLILVFGLKILLSPILIFNLNMGMSGASLATMLSYGSVFILEFYLLRKKELISSVRKKFAYLIKNIKYNWRITRQTLKIGLPLSLEGLTFSLIYVFVAKYVAEFGTVGLASLGIGHRSEAIPYQIGEAFAVTAAIIVGQNVGARNYERAEKGAWRVLLLSFIPMSVYSIALFFFPEQIAGIFTGDPSVIATAKVYNMIAAFSIFFAMSEAIFAGAFAGAGNSIPPLAIYLPVTALRIPLAAILAPIYGINGIWYAIFSTSMTKGVLIAIWFRLGRWKKVKVDLGKEQKIPSAEVEI